MAGSEPGPKFSAEGVRDHLGNRQSWLSYAFGIAAIVFVAIDLFADHQAWAGVAAIICILLGIVTRPSGFFGQRGPT
jgi:membrane-bound ClpP family serine protease